MFLPARLMDGVDRSDKVVPKRNALGPNPPTGDYRCLSGCVRGAKKPHSCPVFGRVS